MSKEGKSKLILSVFSLVFSLTSFFIVLFNTGAFYDIKEVAADISRKIEYFVIDINPFIGPRYFVAENILVVSDNFENDDHTTTYRDVKITSYFMRCPQKGEVFANGKPVPFTVEPSGNGTSPYEVTVNVGDIPRGSFVVCSYWELVEDVEEIKSMLKNRVGVYDTDDNRDTEVGEIKREQGMNSRVTLVSSQHLIEPKDKKKFLLSLFK